MSRDSAGPHLPSALCDPRKLAQHLWGARGAEWQASRWGLQNWSSVGGSGAPGLAPPPRTPTVPLTAPEIADSRTRSPPPPGGEGYSDSARPGHGPPHTPRVLREPCDFLSAGQPWRLFSPCLLSPDDVRLTDASSSRYTADAPSVSRLHPAGMIDGARETPAAGFRPVPSGHFLAGTPDLPLPEPPLPACTALRVTPTPSPALEVGSAQGGFLRPGRGHASQGQPATPAPS